jgi:hypothetical protein
VFCTPGNFQSVLHRSALQPPGDLSCTWLCLQLISTVKSSHQLPSHQLSVCSIDSSRHGAQSPVICSCAYSIDSSHHLPVITCQWAGRNIPPCSEATTIPVLTVYLDGGPITLKTQNYIWTSSWGWILHSPASHQAPNPVINCRSCCGRANSRCLPSQQGQSSPRAPGLKCHRSALLHQLRQHKYGRRGSTGWWGDNLDVGPVPRLSYC